jgi:hypothetical protein
MRLNGDKGGEIIFFEGALKQFKKADLIGAKY